MNGTEEQAESSAPQSSTQDFLKKHVRGIPHEKMKERKVHYGFKYRDLKNFISSLIAENKDIKNPELLAKISELEIKVNQLEQQKQALSSQLEEAKDRPDPEALKELEEKLAEAEASRKALEKEKEALEARMEGSADEQAKRAHDLGAELEALKATFARLEEENEFIDGEMQKLDATNKELQKKVMGLESELKALREEMQDRAQAFDAERAGLNDKIGDMEKIITSSKDTQKLLELQKQYAQYKDLLTAYETAAAEAVDVETRPDPEAVAGGLEAVRGKVAGESKAASMAGLLEERYNLNEEFIRSQLEVMFEGKGSFRVILELGKALTRSQELASGVKMLDEVT